MLPGLHRVLLRFTTHPRCGRTPVRRNHAHPRHRHPRLGLTVPLLIIAAGGLVFARLDTTRAMPSATWIPLPASAFRELPALAARPPSRTADAAAAAADGSAGRVGRPDTTARAIDQPAGAPVRPDGASDASSALAAVRSAPTAGEPPKGPTHIVAAGDTLWTIAMRHKADLAAVLRWNQELDPYRLVAGQRILVPGGSKMAPLPRPELTASSRAVVRPSSANRAPTPKVAAGGHIWPLPVRGVLSRGFSAAHLGIDIAAPLGTRVRAIAGGTVAWAGWKNNGGGLVVVVDHPNGMVSTYNHNSKVTVARGDVVSQGDTIALVGSTGNSTGPHLDVRIEMGGRFVDPLAIY